MSGTAISAIDAPTAKAATSPGYALVVLTGIYAFNQLDRQVLSLVMESMKKDFQVSDTVMALISGFGFAAIYVTAGLFISRWADRGPRMAIISLGLAAYSALTALTGLAANVWQLAFSRVGVAIGEATSIAPSTSVLSDYFPLKRRARAMSVFSAGGFIATLTLYPLLGWIDVHHGWRMAFVAAGLPGLLLAIIAYLTVREPRRGAAEDVAVDRSLPPIGETLRFLVGQRSVLLICSGACFSSWTLYCFVVWSPTYLLRVHHLTPIEVGWTSGVLYSSFGVMGGLFGGFLSDRLGRYGVQWRLTGTALLTILNIPFGLLFLFATSNWLTFAGYAGLAFITTSQFGPIWAALQSAVKVRMRALTASLFNAFWMMSGLGLGILVVGMLSDHLHASLGQEAIRYALLAPLALQLVGAPLMALAGLSLPRDIARATSPEA